MDRRITLPSGAMLPFPGMECTVEGVVGRGSNGIVYRAWYPDRLNAGQKHHVLIKELFPYHPQGAIWRGADGGVACSEEGRDVYEIHRRSFECGNEVHLKLLEDHPDRIGANLNTFTLNNTLYTVMGYTGGRSFDQELDVPQSELSLKLQIRRILGVLNALEAFHNSGFLHLDVSPDNILLIGRGEEERVVLIDFNSVHSLSDLQSGAPLYYSAKPGYTPPEVQSGAIRSIGRATDLYAVLAVFYRCLMGKPISLMQMIRPTPPDAAKSPYLEDVPETVRSMVGQIFRRGLNALPEKRYQSAGGLRAALRELIDRIDGVGVTHWALWEAGKRNVDRAVRINPSLNYIRAAEALYPLRGRCEDGETLPIQACISRLMDGNGGHALLTGPGGMGKTTALLCAVQERTQRYSPAVPAMLYVPLYGWKRGDAHYITDRILEDLRFKEETSSFADARHALLTLMDVPISTRAGQLPSVFILLDGLNEAGVDAGELIGEILELSQREGVRLLATSRSDAPALPFERIQMEPLSGEDVRAALSLRGLLLPEGEAMRQLLRTPLMLSIFIQAAQAGEKQLRIKTRQELMDTYFTALMEKEVRALPESAPEKWRIEAALSFVLPHIARQTTRIGRALSDRELLPAVEECYKTVSSRGVASLFPRWIGHSRDIRGGAASAEEWYGSIVHELLWQRMGLLVRDGQDRYRIAHQIIEAHLAEQGGINVRKLKKHRFIRRAIAGACAVILLATGGFTYRNYIQAWSYDATQAELVFDRAMAGFGYAASLNESVRALAEDARAGGDMQFALVSCRRQISQALNTQANAQTSVQLAQVMVDSVDRKNEVMPFSRKPFAPEEFGLLVSEASLRAEKYGAYLEMIEFMLQDGAAMNDYFSEYLDQLDVLVATDRDILSTLYGLVCAPHMSGLRESDPQAYDQYMLSISMAGIESPDAGSENLQALRERLAVLAQEREKTEAALDASGVTEAFKRRGIQ